MKCSFVFKVFIFVLLSAVSGNVWTDENSNNYSRIKRQTEQWVWGISEALPSIENKITKLNETEDNPCELPLLTKPDFNAPGRRVSDIKCAEYIWEIKNLQYEALKYLKCEKYMKKHPGTGNSSWVNTMAKKQNGPSGRFPHLAAVGFKAAKGGWIFKCGGTLISSKYVMTAAHCTKLPAEEATVSDPVPKIVRIGEKNIVDVLVKGLRPNDVSITKIIVHPKYDYPKKYYDIALMELENDVKFSNNIRPACLWSNFDSSRLGSDAVLPRYGVIDLAQGFDSKTSSLSLQAADLDIIQWQKCDSLLESNYNEDWHGFQEHQFCAGKFSGRLNTCQGDTGGPLQVDIPLPWKADGPIAYVIGVASFSFGCGVVDKLGIYTRVSSFVDWIEQTVWPCDTSYLSKPNFVVPGRRISESKCSEYIWDIKYRRDKEGKENVCKNYNGETTSENSPISADTGGISNEYGEFPDLAVMGWEMIKGGYSFKCGGTLVSSKFVLTAAHCSRVSHDQSLVDSFPKVVRLGDRNIIDAFVMDLTSNDIEIAKVIVHPEYRRPMRYHDIALLELKREAKLDRNIRPGCLWSSLDTSRLGTEASIPRWSVVDIGSDSKPTLQAAVVDVIDSSQCNELLKNRYNRKWPKLEEHQICAGKLAGGSDTCMGDSGSPLQMKLPLPWTTEGSMYYVIGLTSFGFSCGEPDLPAIYTRISSHLDWIEETVWPQKT